MVIFRYACDKYLAMMMRERTLGNSVTKLHNMVQEVHSEQWSHRCMQYLTACSHFANTALVTPPEFQPPPPVPVIPKPAWFMGVHLRDVLLHLDEFKARVTSTFGRVLKLDSTKKVSNMTYRR